MASIEAMLTLAFREPFLVLAPQFERVTGHKVAGAYVPTAIMVQRLKGGEVTDLVVVSSDALDEIEHAGALERSSRVVLATCGVGVAVPKGAPKPDLTSGEALKRAVLAAKSVVYSHGPSGVYLAQLFERMGIADQIAAKVKRVQGEPAGAVLARGEADLGFQQVCELLPVPGIDFVGPLPADVQVITTFGAAVHARAKSAEAARAFVDFLTRGEAAEVMRSKGLEPVKR